MCAQRTFVFLVLIWSTIPDALCGTQPKCNADGLIISCMLEENDLVNAESIELNIPERQTVHLYRPCLGSDGDKCLCNQSKKNSSKDPVLSSEGAGNEKYTIICGNLSIRVVHAPQRRPSVPVLKLQQQKVRYKAWLLCTSDGNPKPSLEWYGNSGSPEEGKKSDMFQAESILKDLNKKTSKDLNKSPNLKCCAKNELGEECTQLFHFDLDEKNILFHEKKIIFRKSGQSFLLQCTMMSLAQPELRWTFNNTVVQGVTTISYQIWAQYLFIESLTSANSGEYLCSSEKFNQTRKAYVEVLENDKIDILQLNQNNRILAENKRSFCFQALVFSYPKAQCYWITPNQSQIQAKESEDSNYNSIYKLCRSEPGLYQIKLQTQEYTVTRNMTLCISDIPKITIRKDLRFTSCETQSSLPVSASWKVCSALSECSDARKWNEIHDSQLEVSDSDQFCQKTIGFARENMNTDDHLIKCCITNVAGTGCSEQILMKTDSYTEYIIYFLSISILLMMIIALIIFIKAKKPAYQSQIQMFQIIGPNENDYIYINFREFKYDETWEFPRENLELGNELGSGAFGMVVQATAYGISEPGVSVQVAVKMLKEKHQTLEKEALTSELKMLTHIGHHENIVNLLGACTGSGPIYLIFQYCCHGDLLNYLKSNRECFHKYLKDAFNKDRFIGLYHNIQQKRKSSEFVDSNNKTNLYQFEGPENKGKEKEQKNEFEVLLDPSAVEERLQCEEKREEEELYSLTYDDLLTFSCQVAKGMEFLSSKNCIHRDLAARNVLVTHGRQVKIGDFGLARDIDHDSNYVVRGNVRLPVKWMAPESIFKAIYTKQSDVWAYGILLWEIFSLGVTPYPGMSVNNTFYRMIESGYHMEQPYYADESVYEVMCCCWSLDPVARPCFSKLVAFMEKALAALEERLYLNFGREHQNNMIYQNAPKMD